MKASQLWPRAGWTSSVRRSRMPNASVEVSERGALEEGFGESAAEPQGFEFAVARFPRDLIVKKRRHIQESGPPRQALGNVADQCGRGRAQQDEAPLAPPLGIDIA